MTKLTLPAPREPAVDLRNGTFTRNWILYLQQSFERMGGSDAESITAITALVRQILQDIADNEVERSFSAPQAANQEDYIEFSPPPVTQQDAQEPTDYAARISELQKQIDELRQEIAMVPDQSAQVGEIRKRVKDISKPAVTGSRSANAALASLITALASYGLITDSTTA